MGKWPKDPNKSSPGYQAGVVLGMVVIACLSVIIIAGTYKLVESWF